LQTECASSAAKNCCVTSGGSIRATWRRGRSTSTSPACGRNFATIHRNRGCSSPSTARATGWPTNHESGTHHYSDLLCRTGRAGARGGRLAHADVAGHGGLRPGEPQRGGTGGERTARAVANRLRPGGADRPGEFVAVLHLCDFVFGGRHGGRFGHAAPGPD